MFSFIFEKPEKVINIVGTGNRGNVFWTFLPAGEPVPAATQPYCTMNAFHGLSVFFTIFLLLPSILFSLRSTIFAQLSRLKTIF